jgi:hypothetical protein
MIRGAALLGLALLVGGFGCEENAERNVAAPTHARAMLLLEPASLGVGEVGVVEVAVVTPPDHPMRPFKPPPSIPGLWLLAVEPTRVERHPGRWIQRTRVRVRAREVGRFTWPEGQVEVEDPEGTVATLSLAPLDFEIASVLPEYPDRLAPFGVRGLPEPNPVPAWLAGGAGAGLSLALVAVITLVLRRRRKTIDPQPPPREPPWVTGRRDIERARTCLAHDPLEAADRGAVALRRYMARRFGADAVARTTQELAAATPPFGGRSQWPRFVSLLEDLDDLRFVPNESSDRARERCERLLDEIARFIDETGDWNRGS